jgi:hypothetical protein
MLESQHDQIQDLAHARLVAFGHHMLTVETDDPPEQLLSEIVSNLESVDVTVDAGCVFFGGNQVAMYDHGKEKK